LQPPSVDFLGSLSSSQCSLPVTVAAVKSSSITRFGKTFFRYSERSWNRASPTKTLCKRACSSHYLAEAFFVQELPRIEGRKYFQEMAEKMRILADFMPCLWYTCLRQFSHFVDFLEVLHHTWRPARQQAKSA
jgi:hypothetical protein